MTKLFSLPLQGAGTEDVECLSSYLIRLSIAHGRSLYQFLEFLTDCSPSLGIELQRGSRPGLSLTIASLSNANSTVEWLLDVLAKVSDVTGLRAATFQCLADSHKRTTSTITGTFRWCPCCMADWGKNNETAYFKLVWLFKHAEYCQHHSVPLISQCPKCNQPQSGYKFRKHLSKCNRCGESLSVPITEKDVVPLNRRTAGDIFQLVEQIALHPDLKFDGSGAQRIITTLGQQAERNEEARVVFNSIFPVYWKRINKRPRDLTFEETRVFAAIIGISLFDALQGNCIGQTQAMSYSWCEGTKNQWKLHARKRKRIDFETVKIALEDYFIKTLGSNPSLSSAADSLGVTVGYLRYRFPIESYEIVKRHKAHKKRVAARLRLAAKHAADRYFASTQSDDRLKSRKSALRDLRVTTDLSKGLLRSEIEEAYKARNGS